MHSAPPSPLPRVPPEGATEAQSSSFSSSSAMTYRQLSEVDDLCTAALVDPVLGFSTHKMALRFRQPGPRERAQLQGVVQAFRGHQDYDRAWKQIGEEVDWWRRTLQKRNSRAWEAMLKEHVRKQRLIDE